MDGFYGTGKDCWDYDEESFPIYYIILLYYIIFLKIDENQNKCLLQQYNCNNETEICVNVPGKG